MSSKALRIGIDVGGTNTDAVIMRGREVLAACKTPTTTDVASGIRAALVEALRQAEVEPARIGSVMIGTTHFTNAFIQARGLERVGVIRLAAPAATSLPPFVDWPAPLLAAVHGEAVVVRGGYNYDGSEISQVDPKELQSAIDAMLRRGIRSVAVSSVFAPVNGAQERYACDLIAQKRPDIEVTLSSQLGRIGLLERENAAIMNAALVRTAREVVRSFTESLRALRLTCPFYVSQNDGTLMPPEHAARFPVLTFASGPTNSIRGGGFLSGLENAIVVDIGGTTTDVGVLAAGFPRESAVAVDVGGVRTNFRMPDVLSIGLGGGSRVRVDGRETRVGPDSVGFRLTTEACVFGGETLTATDVAVAAGKASVGDPAAVRFLDRTIVSAALERIRAMLDEAVDRMKTSAARVPVVLVGGGSILAHRDIHGASEVIVPAHAGVANAIGAAIAQVSGEVDQVFSYQKEGRDIALARARNAATAHASAAGALPETIRIMDIEELPLQYLPGDAVRVRVKAVGELAAAVEA